MVNSTHRVSEIGAAPSAFGEIQRVWFRILPIIPGHFSRKKKSMAPVDFLLGRSDEVLFTLPYWYASRKTPARNDLRDIRLQKDHSHQDEPTVTETDIWAMERFNIEILILLIFSAARIMKEIGVTRSRQFPPENPRVWMNHIRWRIQGCR